MIRFLYNRQVTPPAPFVHVMLRPHDASQEVGWLPAQLDSAATRTVVPLRLVEEMGLLALDEIAILGVGGHVTTMPTFLVQIEIRQQIPRTLEVVAHADEPFVLLGRDILNQFRIVMDGPGLALEID